MKPVRSSFSTPNYIHITNSLTLHVEPLLHDSGLSEIVDEEHQGLSKDEVNCRITAIIHGAFYANVFLFFAKCFASYSSLSLSVIASTLDSLLDLLSGSIIFVAACIVDRNRESRYAFPAGTSRIEPLVSFFLLPPHSHTLSLTLTLTPAFSRTLTICVNSYRRY